MVGSALEGDSGQLPAVRSELVPDPSALPTLAAGLVHEVKNPLAAIHLHLQLLEGYMAEVDDDQLRRKMQEKVSIIKNEIHGLNRTLHNFISFLRPRSDGKDVAVDLNETLRGVVDLLEPQALRDGIDVHFDPNDIGYVHNVDVTFIKQIALNLILNSIQAFRDSARPMEERRILVRTGRREGLAFFLVADNGPGMSEVTRARVFDPFCSTKGESGSGLGLTLVQRMVAELGGALEIHTIEGEGTTFAVFLGGKPEHPLLDRQAAWP